MASWKKDYFRYKDFFLNVLSVYNAKPNFKVYLGLLLSLSTIVVFLIFAVKPTVLTIIELNKEIKGKEETLSNLNAKIANLEIANNLLQSEANNIQHVYQAVPKVAEPEVLIKQVEILSNEALLKILGFSFSDVLVRGEESEEEKDKNELAFTYSATGSYQSLFSFLTQLESLRKPVKFDSFVINASSTEEGKVLVVTINARVPFLQSVKRDGL